MSKKFLVILVSLVLIGLAFPVTPAWAQEQEEGTISRRTQSSIQ